MNTNYKTIKASGYNAIIQAGNTTYVHLWMKGTPVFSLYLDFETGSFSTNDRVSEVTLKEFTDKLNADEIKHAAWPYICQ